MLRHLLVRTRLQPPRGPLPCAKRSEQLPETFPKAPRSRQRSLRGTRACPGELGVWLTPGEAEEASLLGDWGKDPLLQQLSILWSC